MARQIKFEFLYRGMPYSAENQAAPWFKKHYTLSQLIEKPLHELSDVHSFSELVAKRQFTGLKDCDGVEIYEGDLVSVFDRDDSEFLTSGVVKFGFRGYPGFDIYDERGDTYSDEYNTFTNDDDLYFKVTGNIYQNPERFKDATKSK